MDRVSDTGPSPLSNGHGTTTGSSPLAALQDSVHSPAASHAPAPPSSPLTPPSSAPAPVGASQFAAPVSGAPAALNGLSFGSRDPYGTQDSYSAPDSYSTPDSYRAKDSYGSQDSYGAKETYGSQDPYRTQDPYAAKDPYGSQEQSQPSYLSPSYGSSSATSTGPTPLPSSSPTSTSPSLPPQSSFTSPTSTGTGGLPAYPLTPPASQPPAQSSPPALPQYGSYTGPNSLVPQSRASQSPSLSDAVQAAHTEGQDFGESVARDAPALWLEAVLARKPRMPSDLEARLLQGSALPIDFLLHDEVRHALRRGFWDALERARR